MVVLVNRAKMTTSTTGTGTITLGSVVDGYQTFAAAGVSNGDSVRYVIEDGTSNWEIGSGTYTASGTTLSRTPSESSDGGSAINLSGDAIVFISAIASDIQPVTYVSTTFTATAGQTAFTVSYTAGLVEVFLNGAKLSAADFTATNGTSVVLASGANVGDTVDVVAYGTVSVSNTYTQAQANALFVDVAGDTMTGALSVTGTLATAPTGNGIHLGYGTSGYAVQQFNGVSGAVIDFSESGVDYNGRILYNNASDYMSFETNATSAMLIEANKDISFYEDTGGTVKFFWDASAESLGIGTTTPSSPIHVYGTTTSGGIFVEDSSASSASPAVVVTGKREDGNDSQAFSGKLLLSKNQTNAAIDNAGDALGTIMFGGNHTDGSISNILYAASISGISDGAFNSSTDMPTAIAFYTGSTGRNGDTANVSSGAERMRIDSSGNLLVGTTNDQPHTGTSTGVAIRNDGGVFFTRANADVLNVNRTTSDGAIAQFRKDGSTVGSIGVVSGNDLFIVNQTKGLRFQADAGFIQPCNSTGSDLDNTLDLGQSSSRFKDLHLSGTANAANFNTTSDATLKTNVETLSGSLDAVVSMRGVSFDWIESGKSEVGVIAQEIEEVIPDLVNTNEQGIKSVKYGNMVAVLIEAMKEQQKRIEALEAQLNS